MYKRNKMLKEVAEKRLAAIREYTELGSGIKVAMRDLEIRGAGNLLGAAQSGHMQAVGYDLYCKMLNDAVRKLKGEQTVEEEFETAIDLQVDAYIPASYIPSEFQKLDMYKRIAGIEKTEEYRELQEELTDRFGDVPPAAENLLRIALLKADAHKAMMTQVVQKNDGIRFYLHESVLVDSAKAAKMLEEYQGKMKYVQGEEPHFCYVLQETQSQVTVRTVGYRTIAQDKKRRVVRSEEIFHIAAEAIRRIGGLYEKE
jgi:transcription-repair coupling factor (superfamily II helicase)